MDPEETSGDRPVAEPLAAEPPAPAVELGESVDQGDSTPPHGDPLAPEVAPLAPSAPEEVAVPEPLDDGSSTPPHGDVLPAAPVTWPSEPSEAAFAVSDPPLAPVEPVAAESIPAVAASAPASAPEPPVEEVSPAFFAEVPAEPASTAPTFAASDTLSDRDLASAAPIVAAPVEEGPSATFPSSSVAPADASDEEPAPLLEPAYVSAEPLDAFEVETDDRVDLAAPAPREGASSTEYAEAVGSAQTSGAESLSFREVEAVRPVDDLEAAALHHPAAATLDAPAAGAAVAPEERHEGSPNWMLAFICAWSGATSLYEAWLLNQSGGLRAETLGLLGYLLLGIGLVAFAIEALGWGRPRRSIAPVLLPTALTLIGVVCLVLWDGPARPL